MTTPTTGTLRIETDVPGATVFLDRIGVGSAPMTIPNIAPGAHRLNVSASGYDGYGETIEVEPGERVITINFKEIKLDARLNAVHNARRWAHAAACSPTPQAIVYLAADGKDSFTIGLTQITTFEVDYLAKNLRIRGPQGRTGTRRRSGRQRRQLHRVHRDVDKDRQRVISRSVDRIRSVHETFSGQHSSSSSRPSPRSPGKRPRHRPRCPIASHRSRRPQVDADEVVAEGHHVWPSFPTHRR